MSGNAYRTKNQAVAAAVEATPGTDAVPTVGANAILLEDVRAAGNHEVVETNEHTGALDDRGPIQAGGTRNFTGTALMKGAGVAGVAPEAGVLYRGCGMAETLLPSPVAGTAGAGTDATHLVLADATGIAPGMVVEVGAQVRVITAVVGSDATVYPAFSPAPAAGDAYTVRACALYRPASVALETLSLYRWRLNSGGGQAKLDRITGAAGTVNFSVAVRKPGRAAFDFRGLLHAPEDVADPGALVLDDVRPYPFLGATIVLGGVSTKVNTLTVDYGGTVTMPDNPLDAMGYDPAGLTARRVGGRINPPLALQSVRNAYAAWRDQTVTELWTTWGDSPGNRVSLYLPEVLYSGSEEEDVQGYAHEGIPFRSVAPDAGLFLCFH